MRDEVQEMRDALASIGALDGETAEALISLEEALDEIEKHPEVGQMRATFRDTAASAASASESRDGIISGKWDQLKEHIKEWENDHPGATLVIGRMANAFSAVGL